MSTRRSRTGRDMSQLLADFGHHLPTTATPDSPPKQGRLFRYAPRRGARQARAGVGAAAAPVAAYRMTSDQAPVFWPFIAGPGPAAHRRPDGRRRAVRGRVLRRPDRVGAAR